MKEQIDKPSVQPIEDADDLRARSLYLLDFHAIRQRAAAYTTFAPARELAQRMTPSNDEGEVELLQQETTEGRALLEHVGEVDQRTTSDVSLAITRAGLGGMLSGMELLAIAESVEVQRRARSTVLRAREKAPLLADIAEAIPDLEELQRQITRLIGNRGEVADDATPRLRALRRQVRQAYERVTRALTRIMQSSVGQETLQDQVISVRGDRLVVQVKAEMRHRIPGIIQGASNTGATLFIEPFSTVELGNAWRELALEEEREVERILRDLSTLVGELADPIRLGIELGARLDFIFARARYSNAIRGVSALPRRLRQHIEGASEGGKTEVRLLNARHPLLGESAVPLNVKIGPEWSVLVITGPNTGGKTVAMKTVGLLAMMHQSGIHVPADEGSVLPVFNGIYADVGDQQSIEQSVSTFSSHMRNVINIMAQAGSASLVLLDELGSSTDPEEGSALAKAILDHLASRHVPTIVTTHHRTVAAYAQTVPEMMNASVDLDPSDLRPTYKLTMGIPGRSYAMSVASHLGLPEEIMDKAQSLLEPQYLRFEDWLNELQSERQQLQEGLQVAEQSRMQSESLRQQLQTQMDYLLSHREDMLDSMRRELFAQYEDARRKLRRAEGSATWHVPPADLKEVKEEIADVGRELKTRKWSAPPSPRHVEERPMAVGDYVSIRGLNLKGTVASLPDQDEDAEVNVGNVRLRVGLNRLSRIEDEEEPLPPSVSMDLGPGLMTQELDLRGLRAGEALVELEEFLDKAVRDGLSSIRVIHGKGTGALRQAVRDHMERHPLVRSYEPEARERGGNGATAIELA